MQIFQLEKLITRILAFGSAFTTIFVLSGSVTDPVNAPKFVALGVVSFAAFAAVVLPKSSRIFMNYYKLFLILLFFVISMSISVIFSDSPLSQNIYGSYGRNNGLLTYLFLVLILASTLVITAKSGFNLILKSLFFAGLVNVAYCLWVILFGDFIGWSNPYGNILGTFGNPDFISAFLGFFFSAYLAVGVAGTTSKKFKYSMVLILPITAFEIVNSHAIQGRAVAVLGIGIVGFYFLRSRFSARVVVPYAFFGVLAGGLAVLGALQIGPLSDYVYKTSVSLRGQYWLSAWNMGKSHPLTGIGMDSLGDWYRRARDAHAIVLPGVNTTTNAAHNVWLDMFAFGGWPLLLTYLGIIVYVLTTIVKVTRRTKSYDGIYVGLVVAWVGYQSQSIISINQIGLATWGWLLSGVLIAYERTTRDVTIEKPLATQKRARITNPTDQYALGLTVSVVGGLIGLMVALPPLSSDSKWRAAQLARTQIAIESTMKANYFNPPNSIRFANNVISLEQAQLTDSAHRFAKEAVTWNPESFELWRILYFSSKSTAADKELALANMKKLDPLNPDVTVSK